LVKIIIEVAYLQLQHKSAVPTPLRFLLLRFDRYLFLEFQVGNRKLNSLVLSWKASHLCNSENLVFSFTRPSLQVVFAANQIQVKFLTNLLAIYFSFNCKVAKLKITLVKNFAFQIVTNFLYYHINVRLSKFDLSQLSINLITCCIYYFLLDSKTHSFNFAFHKLSGYFKLYYSRLKLMILGFLGRCN